MTFTFPKLTALAHWWQNTLNSYRRQPATSIDTKQLPPLLPKELWQLICHFADAKSLCALASTCKPLYVITTDYLNLTKLFFRCLKPIQVHYIFKNDQPLDSSFHKKLQTYITYDNKDGLSLYTRMLGSSMHAEYFLLIPKMINTLCELKPDDNLSDAWAAHAMYPHQRKIVYTTTYVIDSIEMQPIGISDTAIIEKAQKAVDLANVQYFGKG